MAAFNEYSIGAGGYQEYILCNPLISIFIARASERPASPQPTPISLMASGSVFSGNSRYSYQVAMNTKNEQMAKNMPNRNLAQLPFLTNCLINIPIIRSSTAGSTLLFAVHPVATRLALTRSRYIAEMNVNQISGSRPIIFFAGGE